jgi:hypothetical protein
MRPRVRSALVLISRLPPYADALASCISGRPGFS